MYAWQFLKAQNIAERHGWTTFVAMQPHYNLIYREEEREMLPLCADLGVGVIPWSPIARGKLSRPVGATSESSRATGDKVGATLYAAAESADRAVISGTPTGPGQASTTYTVTATNASSTQAANT